MIQIIIHRVNGMTREEGGGIGSKIKIGQHARIVCLSNHLHGQRRMLSPQNLVLLSFLVISD